MATEDHRLGALPVGTGATGTRVETDSMGAIEVPADHYWGAQTQRSLHHFSIGDDRMPQGGRTTPTATSRRRRRSSTPSAGRLPQWKADAIVRAADEVIAGAARRRVPALRVADRVGHADQHERQRGDRQPRHPAARRRAGQQGPGPPERRRQHGPVAQRHASPRRCTSPRSLAIDDRLLPAAGRARATRSQAKAERVGATSSRSAAPTCRTPCRSRVGQEWSGLGRAARRRASTEVEHALAGPATSWRSAAPRSAPG